MPLKHEVSLVGAPADAGASRAGARYGPPALRAAGLAIVLQRRGVAVHDAGDLTGPRNPEQPPVDGYRHLGVVGHWCQSVHDAVLAELTCDRLPLLIGGDHSLAIGSISAVARHCLTVGRPLRVLWFDAHADCNSRSTSPSANLHGMPVACLRGIGPPTLTSLAGRRPALAANQLHLIGVRSVDPGEAGVISALELEVSDMQTLRAQGVDAVMARALAGLNDNAHLHVSLDLDFLDPSVAPGTGLPVADGASLAEAHACLQWIRDSGRLGSMDVMELDPTRDPSELTARRVVDLLAALLGRPGSEDLGGA